MAIYAGMNEIDRKIPSAALARSAASRPMQAFKPFCSKRCADVDLNRWLKGVYAVPVKEENDEDGERPPEREAGEPT